MCYISPTETPTWSSLLWSKKSKWSDNFILNLPLVCITRAVSLTWVTESCSRAVEIRQPSCYKETMIHFGRAVQGNLPYANGKHSAVTFSEGKNHTISISSKEYFGFVPTIIQSPSSFNIKHWGPSSFKNIHSGYTSRSIKHIDLTQQASVAENAARN